MEPIVFNVVIHTKKDLPPHVEGAVNFIRTHVKEIKNLFKFLDENGYLSEKDESKISEAQLELIK